MLEEAGRPRLLLEPAQPVGVLRDGLGQDLDGDVAAEAGVAGAVDLAHAAGPDGAHDLVRADPIPGLIVAIGSRCASSPPRYGNPGR